MAQDRYNPQFEVPQIKKRARPPQRQGVRLPPNEELKKLLSVPDPETAAPTEPGWAPTIVRGVGGLFGVTPITGAVAGGVSEGIAQMIEGDLDLPKLGSSVVVGGAGGGLAKILGKILLSAKSAGQAAAQSAGRGAIFGGGTSVAQNAIEEGELPTMEEFGASAAMGASTSGLAGGALYKLLGGMKLKGMHDGAPAPKPGPTVGHHVPNQPSSFRPTHSKLPRGRIPYGIPDDTEDLPGLMDDFAPEVEAALERNLKLVPSRAEAGLEDLDALIREGREQTVAQVGRRREQAKNFQAEWQKKIADMQAQRQIDKLRESGEFDEVVSFGETYSGRVPGGKQTGSRRFVPKQEDGEDLPQTRKRGRPAPSTAAPAPTQDPILEALKARAAAEQAPVASHAPTGNPSRLITPPPVAPTNSPDDLLSALRGLASRRSAPRPGNAPTAPQTAPAVLQPELISPVTGLPQPDPQKLADDIALVEWASRPETIAETARIQAEHSKKSSLQLLREAVEEEAFDYAKPVGRGSTVGAAAPEAAPLPFHKSRVDASGAHYRTLNALLRAGEPDLPSVSPRIAGAALQREAAAAGLPTKRPVHNAPPPPNQNVIEQLKASIEKIKADKKPGGGSLGPSGGGGSSWGGQGGQIAPDLAAALGLGVVGAGVGAATDPFDNPLLSAAVVGGAAAASPAIVGRIKDAINRIGAAPPEAQALVDDPQSTMERIASNLPSYIRSNMLFSPNILNNAFVGPYGSGMMTGMELMAAGDPRGQRLLELLTPEQWAVAYREVWPEALERIKSASLAQGERFEVAASGGPLKFPAQLMTAGDLATRRLMQLAGLTDEEARAFTMTSEPLSRAGKSAVNWQRTSNFGATTLPFVKTLANIVEQSAMRTPGIGPAASRYLGQNVPEAVQAARQTIGGATLAGSAGVGYLMPQAERDDRYGVRLLDRLLRGFVSNIAGPYSGVATAGFGMGRAAQAGGELGDVIGRGASEAIGAFPMPTADTYLSYANVGRDVLNNEIPKTIPPGAVPMRHELQGLYDLLTKEQGGGRKPRQPRKPREAR